LPRKFSPFIHKNIRQRANFLCEYCHTDEKWQLIQFTIDHIIPVSDDGSDELENLALACFHCNRKKSNKQSFYDPQIDSKILIFNPRKMSWKNHFIWSKNALEILYLTDIGRITIELLELNRPRILQIRQDDVLVKRHPPENDPIEM